MIDASKNVRPTDEERALAFRDTAIRSALRQIDRLRADIVAETGLSWDQFEFDAEIDGIEWTLKRGLER